MGDDHLYPPDHDDEETIFSRWIECLDEEVMQNDHGYEPGEFLVDPDAWRPLFDEGLTPQEAFNRALQAHQNG
ncbi:MAG: hypothetical protein GDA50_04315 [Alphaproteobacteria bacterium GM202ARS2]|nr:hypothetical protein [Alphaproteobacteria bacterium GM202ARS2]